MSTWSAGSDRRVPSPASCNASAVRATRSADCRKGALFPQSRDDLVECAALLDSVRRGELDRLTHTAPAARRAGAADRRRGGGAGLARGGAVRPDAPRLALSRPVARRLHRRRAHAGRGLHHPARPPRRVAAPRRGQPHAARPARRAADRADLGRRRSRTTPTTRCCWSRRTRRSAA